MFIINGECLNVFKNHEFKYIVSKDFNDIKLLRSLKPRFIIFDSYLANNHYLNELKKISPLAILDDNNDIYDSNIADLIINGNIHADRLNYNSKTLLGPKYLIMRPEYWDVRISKNFQKSICITTGGSDANNLMPRFMKSLKRLQYNRKIIIGPGYRKQEIDEIESIQLEKDQLIYKPSTLIDIFNDSTIVLTASGTSIYEILRLNKIPIVYSLADNQRKIAKKMEDYGVVNLGNYQSIDYSSIESIVNKHFINFENKRKDLKELFKIFDGQGSIRVAKYIINMIV